MSVNIVEGVFYKRADGMKCGPAKVDDRTKFPWNIPPSGQGFHAYSSDGKSILERQNFDIISEWSEGPVRTVTRREVVEWSDDILTVVPHEDGNVLIGFKHPHDQHYISLSKKQILSACMIMSQIAEAMDDGEGK